MNDRIIIRGAKEHNLKNIDVEIPKRSLSVITGVSGSGKSSLAFDTLYAEGQRRYVESLSAYARQFLDNMGKPDVLSIDGLSPAISIQQKTVASHPRSTVGTVTEIYDYLRLLYARVADAFCHQCGKPITSQTVQTIADQVLAYPENSKINLIAPIVRGRKGEYQKELLQLRRDGFTKIRIDGKMYDLSDDIELDKNKRHDIDLFVDRIQIKEENKKRIKDSVETALKAAQGILKVEDTTELPVTVKMFSTRHTCIECGISYPDPEPRLFSFNSMYGACSSCRGLGYEWKVSLDKLIPDAEISFDNGAIPLLANGQEDLLDLIRQVSKHADIDLKKNWKDLTDQQQNFLLKGSGTEKIKFTIKSNRGATTTITKPFIGILGLIEQLYKDTESSPDEDSRAALEDCFEWGKCEACHGARLRPESLGFMFGGKNIFQVGELEISDCSEFFKNVQLKKTQGLIADRVLKEIKDRLQFLENVGLSYLTLNRPTQTLSGGESQRIRLATQIGSSLTGVLYVLDEPSIGLHQSDNSKLISTLKKLRDLGNTVIVVEHDRDTMESADYIVDIGPGAGKNGGSVVAFGVLKDILECPESLTGSYLRGDLKIGGTKNRKSTESIEIKGLTCNNLDNFDAEIPLGCLVGIGGVSGSGKSSLILDSLYPLVKAKLNRRTAEVNVKNVKGLEKIDRVIEIDQSPIGRTPRSNPATYVGFFTAIRDLFSNLPESKMRGFKPGRFSFNVKGGRCESCQGDGLIRVEMHFLPDVYVRCETCRGRRYNADTLSILYRDRNIADVLEMTVEQALEFFNPVPLIKRPLQTLSDVGLGYLHLGQQATTLSGGEAQRIKIARELSKRSTTKTLYILDEPSTGLHFEDVRKLVDILQMLVDQGNTVIVIEHNLDILFACDYIIDMGPGGGRLGGQIVAEGTPKEIARNKKSVTGPYLKSMFT